MKKQLGLREALRKAGPYPYDIKVALCPDRLECKGLDPWAVLEFVRIEALLRSSTVHAFYRTRSKGVAPEEDELAAYGV